MPAETTGTGCGRVGVTLEGCQPGGSSEKCHCGVNSVSKANGECQKWCLPVSDQIRGGRLKKREKMAPTSTLSLEKVPTDPRPSRTHPKISQCITFTYNSGAFQIAASVSGLRKSPILVSYSSLALPNVNPAGFSKSDVVGLFFLVQVSQAGAQTPHFSEGDL